LQSGGVKGHKGGTGRPPSAIRKLLLGDLERVRTELLAVLDQREKCRECGRNLSDADLIRLAHFYARYGLGESSAYDPDLMTELGEAVADVVGLDTWHEVRAKWVQILGRYLKP
jgi:hypothetical protein